MLRRKFDVMVGVSSRQNTANLVPFVQFDGERLLLLETDKSRKEEWGRGISQVVESKKLNCQMIPIGNGTNIAEIEKALELYLQDEDIVCWNFGGGQKLQQLALFNHFKLRVSRNFKDWACYAEPQDRKIFIITPANTNRLQELVNQEIATDCNLDIQDVFSVFNYKSLAKEKLLWQRTGLKDGSLYADHLLSEAQESWFDIYENRQNIFRFVLEVDLNNQKKSEPKPLTMTAKDIFPLEIPDKIEDEDKFGDYFERLVQSRIARIFAAQPQTHTVNQIWANVLVKRFAGGNQIAEYDLVLVTNFGTIIPIDAKSFEFAKKDEDARLHNLNRLSGYYTDFWSVFPYYSEDLRADSILQKEGDLKALLRNPFRLQERKSKMLGLSEPGSRPVTVYMNKKERIDIVARDSNSRKISVEVKPLESIIQTLRLSRKLD